MQYAVLIHRDESKDAEVDWPRIDAEYGKYAKALMDAGLMRGGAKLEPSRLTSTFVVRDGQTVITDGPYAETREHLGGFFLIECADDEEARQWAARCPGLLHGIVELRPLAGM